jgi:hypothetical protein
VLEIFVYDVVSKIVAEMLEASLVIFLVVPQIFAHFQLRPKRFENIREHNAEALRTRRSAES